MARAHVRLSDLGPAARAVVAGTVDTVPVDGPWNAGFCVALPFAVRSKSNARRFRQGSRPRAGDDWASFADFEARVGDVFAAAVPAAWDPGDPAAPVAARPVVVCFIAARTLLDSANISKSVVDAGQKVLYPTDTTVRATGDVTVRSRSRQHGHVGFAQLDAAATLPDIYQALSALGAHVVDRFTETDTPA